MMNNTRGWGAARQGPGSSMTTPRVGPNVPNVPTVPYKKGGMVKKTKSAAAQMDEQQIKTAMGRGASAMLKQPSGPDAMVPDTDADGFKRGGMVKRRGFRSGGMVKGPGC